VACKWRIRHKLMLGIGLVVGIMAFLLVGTLQGLFAYRDTMRSIDSKLEELIAANDIRASLEGLVARPGSAELSEKVFKAREALDAYRQRLKATIDARRDPDGGYNEKEKVKALSEGFIRLDTAVAAATEPRVDGPGRPDLQQPVDDAKASLLRTAGDLIGDINLGLHERIAASKKQNSISLAILVSSASLSMLLVLIFGRTFYRWIATPIRNLEAGVGRIAKGDFEHRLEIHSGDEMEDLALAFNTMSSKLRDIYRDLHNQVNERSRQLVRSERLAGVGFLAAGVAHEINNPLASIAFCSEALERRLDELFEARRLSAAGRDNLDQERDIVAKYLKMIQEEAFRCKEITQKLLAFSRGGERKRERTDLAEIVQGVLDMVQHLQSCKGKQLVFQPHEPLEAWVNGQEIKQVFLNLVVNALDSMDEGGALTITPSVKDGTVELIFQDTGCGMTPDILENIFEPFFTRSRTGKGTGLGLSISHRIISSHGGEITAASAGSGQGSTFTVRLPIEQPAELRDGGDSAPDPEAEFLKLSNAQRERQAA
jgi:two-component system, NtrC family, sensor kinase